MHMCFNVSCTVFLTDDFRYFLSVTVTRCKVLVCEQQNIRHDANLLRGNGHFYLFLPANTERCYSTFFCTEPFLLYFALASHSRVLVDTVV